MLRDGPLMAPRHLKAPPALVLAVIYRTTFAAIVVSCAAFAHAQGTITTIAGNGQFRFTGNGGRAVDAPLGQTVGVATDPQGNVYAADRNNHVVVKITTTGVLTIVAGNGAVGYSGDGGPATEASLIGPAAVATDGAGNVFVLDSGACVVRKVAGDGSISTFVGSGRCGFGGDGGAATQAVLHAQGIAIDSRGNLYIADTSNGRVRKVSPQGIISTVAGNGQCCNTVDGVQAINTSLGGPYGVAADQNGVLYIADTFNDRVRRVGTDGIITTIAGGNGRGYSGDGGPATAAMLNWPAGVALDGTGDIYIADMFNQRARKITPDGIIRTIAGTGTVNFTGDQGPGQLATLDTPSAIAVDAVGNVYIADSLNFRVRRVDPAGTITTYAGNGNYGFAGDGGQARAAVLNNPSRVLVDATGNVYISDTGNNRVRRIAPNGVITTVAGGGAAGFAGDGGPATQALLSHPAGLALDGAGNLYIADTGSARVRKVDPNGTITTFAGNGASPANGNGDGGPAANASFGSVTDIAFDIQGNLYIADGLLLRIRKVSPGGTITTFYDKLNSPGPQAIAVDAAGSVYVSAPALQFSTGTSVERISADGTGISFVGRFANPGKIAFDTQGNLYVPDSGVITNEVFLVSPSGAQTVIAGTGQAGFAGDEGPALQAQVNAPTGVALDFAGNLYIADRGNNRIRKVFLNASSGLFQPTLQMTLQPGYYIATVSLGKGGQPGYWGMEVLAPVGVLAGGFNLGGTIQRRGLPPGFGGVYVPFPQGVHVHVDAQAADGSGDSTVGLGVQLLDASRNPVVVEQFGGTSVDFTQTLPTGFYVIEVRGGNSSPIENFQMGMMTGQFAGGAVAGGFAEANTIGFGAFFLTAPQQVTIQVFGQPSYGADGAGGLRLTLLDARRNLIATVP